VTITRDAPWLNRFMAWMNERFPPLFLVVNCIVFVTVITYGRTIDPNQELHWHWVRDILGMVAFCMFPFMLRVFDEHKDFEADKHNHPERVLQRGVISLKDLRVVCCFGIAVQWGGSVYLDGGFGEITQLWVCVMLWAMLMGIEFFCGEWLQEHLFLYAFSHQLISPLGIYWVLCMASPGTFPGFVDVGFVLLLSFFAGFAFEISRKLKMPDEERSTVDSYTKEFGTRRAPLVALFFMVAETVAVSGMILLVNPGTLGIAWVVISVALLVLCSVPFLRFSRKPEAGLPTKMEGASGVLLLVNHFLVLAAIFSA